MDRTASTDAGSTTPIPRRLRPDDFVTYDELLMLLPQPMNKDAIRKLVREKRLPVHKIGMHRMFLGAEVIAASADHPSESAALADAITALAKAVDEQTRILGECRELIALRSDTKRPKRMDLESRAIVLASTMDSPNLSKIARELGVPRSTLQRWKHLARAISQRTGAVRSVRRGYNDGDGEIDGIDD